MNQLPPDLATAIAAASAESPYERLGVAPDSSAGERKRAYRALSRLLHPDVISDPALRPRCNDALVRVNEAFEILSDPIRELAWRARNAFTMPGGSRQRASTADNRPFSPPPPSDHPEVRELTELINGVIQHFSIEQLEGVTQRLINRLLYARDCRIFILDPALRASAEVLISHVIRTTTAPNALTPAISLVRLFLFEQSHPLYRRTVATLLARIVTLLEGDTPLGDLDQLFSAARSLDNGAVILRNSECIEAFSRRLRQALVGCRTNRASEVDRVILLNLQQHHECLPTSSFIEIAQEAYATLLCSAYGSTEAADVRRRLHLLADDALSVVTSLLDQALEIGNFERARLYLTVLRFDLSREQEISLRAEKISNSLITFFQAAKRSDTHESLAQALTFIRHLPEGVRIRLARTATLRRAALRAYRRNQLKNLIPAEIQPQILLEASLLDRACALMFG